MRIIADCGSTSCKWILEGINGRLSALGINPSVMSPSELSVGFDANRKLFENLDTNSVSQVNFYGTGCLSEATKLKVYEWLTSIFSNAEIIVDSDLYGACLAVHSEGQKTAVGILGTGSAATGFDGKDILRLTPSLGYQLADEGAGSDIGRRLLLAYLYGEMPKELSEAFYARFPETEVSWVIDKVYAQQVGSAFLAKHTQLAVDYPEHPFILNLVKEALSIFIQRHMKPLFNQNYTHAGMIGSVAYGFQHIVEKLLLDVGFDSVTIIKDPLDALPHKVWNL